MTTTSYRPEETEMTRDRYPFIRPDTTELTPAARAVIRRNVDKWARHPQPRHADTIRDQWDDFERTEQAIENEKDRNR